MGFRACCRTASDEREPIGRRYKALRSAVERYAWLTRTSFQSVFLQLKDRCNLRVGSPSPPDAISAATAMLEDARSEFLVLLNATAAQRRSEKHAGRRLPRKGAFRDLYRSARLGTPTASALGDDQQQ